MACTLQNCSELCASEHAYIAHYDYDVWVGAWDGKAVDIQVNDDCASSNDVVKVGTCQTDQSVKQKANTCTLNLHAHKGQWNQRTE